MLTSERNALVNEIDAALTPATDAEADAAAAGESA
jgi:hypothetical protein